jgi:hypothetical protein
VEGARQIHQLQALSVEFTARSPEFRAAGLAALSALRHNLHALRVTCPGFTAAEQQQDYSALSSLSSLTRPVLPYAAGTTGLAAVSSCSSLQWLSLSGPAGCRSAGPSLGEAECAAIGQLTQLTNLRLSNIACSDELLSALPQLQQLQMLGVEGLKAADALPVLARLPQLATLPGHWQESAAASGATMQLASVNLLVVAGECIPFQAFLV